MTPQLARFCIVFLAILISTPSIGQDDPVTLQAELSRSRAYIGDVVTYQILVRGANSSTPPTIDFPGSVAVEYRGASSQSFTTMRSINGRQRSQTDSYYRHQYSLTVIKEGLIEIPEAKLTVGSQTFHSKPVHLEAILPELSPDDQVEITLPDRPIYVGESAVAHVSWWIADQTQGLSFESSVFPNSIRVTPASPQPPQPPTAQEHELSLFGQRFNAYLDQGIYQGKPMTRLRFDLILTPTMAGNFEFGPARVVFTRQNNLSRTSRMYAESPKVNLQVVEVPTTNRPDQYQGLIGNFTAQTDASNTQVNVGDPITLRLMVTGPDPMIGLKDTLDAQSLESAGFRVSPDGWREVDRRRQGQRLFTTTIRATTESITQIPPIRLPAFNPESGKFEVFASNPIPLKVKSVRLVTLSDAQTSDNAPLPPQSQSSPRAELIKNPSLLWAHPNAEQILKSSKSFSLRQTLADPLWIGLLALLIGMPIASIGIRRARSRHDPRSAQIQRAWKRAKKLHARGDDAAAIRVYGGAILGIDPNSLTSADLTRLAVSKDIAERSSAVLTETESMHFGTLPQARSDTTLLRAMRRDIRLHQSGHRPKNTRRTHR